MGEAARLRHVLVQGRRARMSPAPGKTSSTRASVFGGGKGRSRSDFATRPFRRQGGRQTHETAGVRTTDGLNSTCMLAWFACGPRLRAPVGTTAAPARARGPLSRRWHSSPGALTPSVPRWASDSSRQLGSVGRRRKDWCVDDAQSASGRASWLAGRGIGRRSGGNDAGTTTPRGVAVAGGTGVSAEVGPTACGHLGLRKGAVRGGARNPVQESSRNTC